jgi:death on curing protein
MKAPVWILRDTVLALHERLLAEFGGFGGCARPWPARYERAGFPGALTRNGKPSVFELAASYAFGLVKNHPFIDGNKRTGFATAVLFLELNRQRFQASEADAVIQTLALAAGAIDEAAYAAWLKANARRAR